MYYRDYSKIENQKFPVGKRSVKSFLDKTLAEQRVYCPKMHDIGGGELGTLVYMGDSEIGCIDDRCEFKSSKFKIEISMDRDLMIVGHIKLEDQ